MIRKSNLKMTRAKGLWLLVAVGILVVFLVYLGIRLRSGRDRTKKYQNYLAQVDPLMEKLERIQAALEVGINYTDYGRHIQDLRFLSNRFEKQVAGQTLPYISQRLLWLAQREYYFAHEFWKSKFDLLDEVYKFGRRSELMDEEIELKMKIAWLKADRYMLKARASIEREKELGNKNAWLVITDEFISDQEYEEAKHFAKEACGIFHRVKEFENRANQAESAIKQIQTYIVRGEECFTDHRYAEAIDEWRRVFGLKEDHKDAKMLIGKAEGVLSQLAGYLETAERLEQKRDYHGAKEVWEKVLMLDPRHDLAHKSIQRIEELTQLITVEEINDCPHCDKGICSSCEGQGICNKCQGTKTCPKCKGKKSYRQKCDRCICDECGGSGKCQNCDGKGFITCSSCSGTGYGQGTKTVENKCKFCDGTGRRYGKICPLCKGKGYTYTQKVKIKCAKCRGKGEIRCSSCRGTGKCPVCKGKGRYSHCSTCGGKGWVEKPCSECGGTGICRACGGTGLCPECGGSGKCKHCLGVGTLRTHYEREGWKILGTVGSIKIESVPSDSKVFLDSAEIGYTPTAVTEVTLGEHVVKLSKEEFGPYEEQIVMARNKIILIKARLQRKAIVEPETPKLPELTNKEEDEINSWLQIGDNFANTGMHDSAVVYYQKVIDNYPESEQAEKAKKRIEEVK